MLPPQADRLLHLLTNGRDQLWTIWWISLLLWIPTQGLDTITVYMNYT